MLIGGPHEAVRLATALHGACLEKRSKASPAKIGSG